MTGAGGQVGAEAVRLGGAGVVGVGRGGLDVTDRDAVLRAVEQAEPDVVVHAAAYTAVDRAEAEADRAYAVNRDGAAHVAEACARAGVPLVHLSTDYVFDGTKGTPYVPDDPPAPLGVYGASKAAGETAVRERLDQHLILRTAWVFSGRPGSFVSTMLRLASERPRLGVVADQWGHPTWATALARACLHAAALAAEGRAPWGTWHVAGAPLTTWHGLAEAAVAAGAERGVTPAVPVDPIATAGYPTAARRPARVELEIAPSLAALGLAPLDWRDGVGPSVDEWAAEGGRRKAEGGRGAGAGR
ncbi:dTDP-4-dehydrorhamnose reductase [Rubrivirga sp. S365]|uniref:dTDP-4-dehydrorhamnose reductase n=1 Tax=Rubrivirga litoralis TaxID=3075598 RepID=A0ABU3BR89_9BACT|nr:MULTISPECIES: dTDP-4-dehydrorhamnose reductase [unclassified Rubrivirga]MDT0631803.1 dTDP-4-dehydrorhamnose reductase [Rubrivirga sp. F394]MDT7856505.1 dTDP-4-dehydrorhamnose reductase [Rubrivirga sp. S365]